MITLADIAKNDYRAREDLVFQNLVNDCLNIIRRFKDGITHKDLLKSLYEAENTRPDDSKHYKSMNGQWMLLIVSACEVLRQLGYIEITHDGHETMYKPN